MQGAKKYSFGTNLIKKHITKRKTYKETRHEQNHN